MRTIITILIACILVGFSSANTDSKIQFLKDKNPIFLDESYYVGFLPIPNKGSMFFWLFESRDDPSTDPLIIWLGGAPGLSSQIDIFRGNGPYIMRENYVVSNPYSWNEVANVLYLDLPLGIGYSTGNSLYTNEEQISTDFYRFLQEFLDTFPQYKGRDLYIAGQAYAGHYIPEITLKIQKQGINMKFKGVAIGNGLYSAFNQYSNLAQFVYNLGIIDYSTYSAAQRTLSVCTSLILRNMTSIAAVQCQIAFNKITGVPLKKFNPFDVRWNCPNPPLCYDFSPIENFLKQENVQKALGIFRSPTLYNQTVKDGLAFDMFGDNTGKLSEVVQSGIDVLMYHGDQDFFFNWKGGETVANNLVWSGARYFAQIPYTQHKYFGQYRFLGNFIYYRLFNSGQMVSYDQPVASLDMITKFISGWS